jgi:hypothetical protein
MHKEIVRLRSNQHKEVAQYYQSTKNGILKQAANAHLSD